MGSNQAATGDLVGVSFSTGAEGAEGAGPLRPSHQAKPGEMKWDE